MKSSKSVCVESTDIGAIPSHQFSLVQVSVKIDSETGETTAEFYLPYSWVPASEAGDLIRLIQKAAEWCLNESDKLQTERLREREIRLYK
jgi:hypothetical protein